MLCFSCFCPGPLSRAFRPRAAARILASWMASSTGCTPVPCARFTKDKALDRWTLNNQHFSTLKDASQNLTNDLACAHWPVTLRCDSLGFVCILLCSRHLVSLLCYSAILIPHATARDSCALVAPPSRAGRSLPPGGDRLLRHQLHAAKRVMRERSLNLRARL